MLRFTHYQRIPTRILPSLLLASLLCLSPSAFSADQPPYGTKAAPSAQGTIVAREVQKPSQAKVTKVANNKAKTKSAKAPKPIKKGGPARGWVLRCGGSSPSWKVEVLSNWLSGTLSGQKVSVPITGKSQAHGRNNVALKTVINGAGDGGRIGLTLRYTRACRSMPFSAKGTINGQSVRGCCRSVRVY